MVFIVVVGPVSAAEETGDLAIVVDVLAVVVEPPVVVDVAEEESFVAETESLEHIVSHGDLFIFST